MSYLIRYRTQSDQESEGEIDSYWRNKDNALAKSEEMSLEHNDHDKEFGYPKSGKQMIKKDN